MVTCLCAQKSRASPRAIIELEQEGPSGLADATRLNFVNAFTGGRIKEPPLDLNRDGLFDNKDNLEEKVVTSYDFGLGLGGRITRVGDRIGFGGTEGVTDVGINPKSVKTGRISWREIVRD